MVLLRYQSQSRRVYLSVVGNLYKYMNNIAGFQVRRYNELGTGINEIK